MNFGLWCLFRVALRVALLLIARKQMPPPIVFRFRPLHWTIVETSAEEIAMYARRQRDRVLGGRVPAVETVLYPDKHRRRSRSGRHSRLALRVTMYECGGGAAGVVREGEEGIESESEGNWRGERGERESDESTTPVQNTKEKLGWDNRKTRSTSRRRTRTHM